MVGYDIVFVLVFSDGKLDVVVPSFVHYLEVLEGSDGDKMPGINIYCISVTVLICKICLFLVF